MTKPTNGKRIEREARLRWVPLAKTRVSPLAQRELNQSWVDHIAADMDLEQLGNPTVNLRDGHYFIIDGQHRIEAYKQWSGEGWISEQMQCWTYEELTEQEEAEAFLKLNNKLSVGAMPSFRVAVTAGRPDEIDIDRIVRAQDLRITSDKIEGGIRAVGTLRRVYARSDGETLGRTLRIIRDAYGSSGLEAPVIDGIGLVCSRYNGDLVDDKAVKQFGSVAGGVNGLLGKAEQLRQRTGRPKAHCVAAAAVDLYNRGRGGGKKLTSWWKSEGS